MAESDFTLNGSNPIPGDKVSLDANSFSLVAGEKVRVQILNSDNSVKSELFVKVCPTGKVLTDAKCHVHGTLSDA